MKFFLKMKRFSWLFPVLFVMACQARVLPTSVPTLDIPTALPLIETDSATESPDPTAVSTLSPPTAAPEQLPTNTATAVSPTNTPEPTQISVTATTPANSGSSAEFSVTYVEPDDVLNVRSGPGVAFSIVGSMPPGTNGVKITGSGQVVSGSTWVPVQWRDLTGWVNSRFLIASVPTETFCEANAVFQLLNKFETAVSAEDDNLLSQLIHPERGLRVRLLWYEPEIRLDHQNLLSDPVVYDWGNAAGSGEPILGTPAQILLPRLQNDFLGATQTACHEILHGGTPGIVALPEAYATINYVSFYRPGTEEFAGLNWGSWAIGVDYWQGIYYLSSLIHYQWEP